MKTRLLVPLFIVLVSLPVLAFAQTKEDAAHPLNPASRTAEGDGVVLITYYRAWSHIQVLGPGLKEELIEIYRPYGNDNQQANMKLLHKELNRFVSKGYEIESTLGGVEFIQFILVNAEGGEERSRRPDKYKRED